LRGWHETDPLSVGIAFAPADPRQLTAEQLTEVDACQNRVEVEGCCGPYPSCSLGRGIATTATCCGCVLAGLPR
jgi:hypothetical protein